MTTRTRNRRGEGALLRADILAAATELLDETGDAQAVTLRAVARQAGITAPSIYPHFADREAILLALTQQAFAVLTEHLRTAVSPAAASAAAGDDPVVGLYAVSEAYLGYATAHPERYRLMFGGVWNATNAVEAQSIAAQDATALGQDTLTVIVEALTACVVAGRSTSTDPYADAVALWLGLHGLAHQRTLSAAFPWPADIAARLIRPLAHLTT